MNSDSMAVGEGGENEASMLMCKRKRVEEEEDGSVGRVEGVRRVGSGSSRVILGVALEMSKKLKKNWISETVSFTNPIVTVESKRSNGHNICARLKSWPSDQRLR